MKLKFNVAKGLTLVTLLGGFALDILSKKAESNDRKTMKAELKDEIMKELLSKEN
jgi:hypothetical protein